MFTISQLKAQFDLAQMVAPYTNGLRPPAQTKYGYYLNGWCPFCQNGQPQKGKAKRFWVNAKSQLCNCMHPKCRSERPMDVINFYARINQLSNKEAIRELKESVLHHALSIHQSITQAKELSDE